MLAYYEAGRDARPTQLFTYLVNFPLKRSSRQAILLANQQHNQVGGDVGWCGRCGSVPSGLSGADCLYNARRLLRRSRGQLIALGLRWALLAPGEVQA